MDQLLAMRAFVRVVDAGTFTKAADLLALPNSSLSKLVQQLEEHLRVKLLQRTTRRVSVTPEGATYYQKAIRLLAELDEIDTGFQVSQARPRGRIRIDMGSSVANNVLVPMLPEFLARFPEIEIDVGVSDRMIDLIGDNVDCVIRGGQLVDPSLVARSIGRTEWVTCASPAYLAAYGLPRHPDDLEKSHRVVSYLSTQTSRVVPLRFSKDDQLIEIPGNATVRINESNGHVAAGLASLGIIQTFSYMVKAQIAEGRLTPLLEDWQPSPYPFYVVFPQNRYLSNRQRIFIDWLIERFPAMLV
jgi:DNA-binding transcriptional LysR family regulator